MFEGFTGTTAGPYHLQKELPNQDALALREFKGYALGALADGAGSLKYSDVGAQEAVAVAMEFMETHQGELELSQLIKGAFLAAREQLFTHEEPKEYGATLVIFLLREDGSGAVGAVGDSFAVLHETCGFHRLVTGTPKGEYANITELLTSGDPEPVIELFHGVDAISLSSDGLEQVAIREGEAHGGFWSGIVGQASAGRLDIPKIFRWLDSLDKLVDDTSLALILRR